jgi:phospholipid/cholesterol/gamma-HCH transport system substrate-binding protein
MTDQGVKFRLGLFVLGAVVLLAVLVFLFGEFPALFSRRISYTVTFQQAPGLEEGTPVRKSGVKIGEVTGYDLDSDTGIVTVRIEVEGKHQLRKGDQAVIGRSLVLGDTDISFLPAAQNKELAPPGYQFEGKPTADLRQALGRASDLALVTEEALKEVRDTSSAIRQFLPKLDETNKEAQVALLNFGKASESVDNLIRLNQERVTKAVDRLAEVAGRAADVLSQENQKNFTAALKNLRAASDNFENLTKNSDAAVTEFRQTVKTVGARVDTLGQDMDELVKEARVTNKRFNETLTRSDEVITNLQQATKPFAERGPAIAKNVDEGSARLNQISVNMADFAKGLAQGDGTIRRLVMDPRLYNNINDAAANLNKTFLRVERIIRDLELFADKIARHPELLGVSGAVSPSSGIKR